MCLNAVDELTWLTHPISHMDVHSLLRLLKPFPIKPELSALVPESTDCGFYIHDKVEFSVEVDDQVRALHSIPQNAERSLAAVFCHHQHAGNFVLCKNEVVGLAGDPEQAYAAELNQRGYIAFALPPSPLKSEIRARDRASRIL